MPRSSLLLATVLLAGVGAAPARVSAQQAHEGPAAITVHIVDQGSGKPLSGASVLVEGTTISAVAGPDGAARVTGIPPGKRVVVVGMLGYEPVRVAIGFKPGADVDAKVELIVQPVRLPTVTAQAKAETPELRNRGFYDRRKSAAGGTFLDRKDLEPLVERGSTLSMAARRLPGFNVEPNGQNGYTIVSTRTGRQCQPALIVDGLIHPASDLDDLDHLIPLQDIAGIESYAGASEVPPQYQQYSTCGVILVWTRSGP